MKFSVVSYCAFKTGILLVTASVCLNACERTLESIKRPNMTALSPRLQSLFEKTRTVCFSQFMLEVPSTATIVHGYADVEFPIIYYPGDGDKIAQHLENQLSEIERDRRFLSKNDILRFSMFGKAIDGLIPGQKLVFGSKDQVTYTIDSFVPVGNDLFVQHGGGISKDDVVKRLNTVASKLRLRAQDEVPAEPGTCLEGGFVALQPEFERASLGVRLKEFPDVHFSVEVTKNQAFLIESSALEPRLNRAEKAGGIWYSRVKFFRRGPRELGNWSGFEALALKPPQDKRTESHQFAFVSLGAIHDPLQPSLDVQLDTGVKDDQTASVKPSITDEEAVALWDRLIGSIRVRPTGDAAKQTSGNPPKFPLGEYIDTGSACPQTGWWQCSEGGEVAGGRRRHFMSGEPMPHAAMLGNRSVWQMIKGQRPSHDISTIWKLVDYDAEPAVPNSKAAAETPTHADLAQITRNDLSATQDPVPPSEGQA